MRSLTPSQLTYLLSVSLFAVPAIAQVTITSPAATSTSISAVRIAASSTEPSGEAYHLEVWDNGDKLGNVSATSVDSVYVLPNGSHTLAVNAVTNTGTLLNGSTVRYTVGESCTTSGTTQCNIDQQGIDHTQCYASGTPQESIWVANSCGSGVQGTGGSFPTSTTIEAITESGTIPNENNTTLNGQSLLLSEAQGSGGLSNVLFSGQSSNKASTSTVDSHWTMDEYVHLPLPAAHQAFEVDAQYVIGGIWSKFYTECAFNINNGTGFWEIYDNNTGGWIVLNGVAQNGQTPPVVPCSRSQFSQPWQYTGSSNPSFTGWHHIVWKFLRNSGGSNPGNVTFESLTFDGTTTQINFTPNSPPGGIGEGNNGDFGALVQLDGAKNTSGTYGTVTAYLNELNISHTP
jgi:hypothetical protein